MPAPIIAGAIALAPVLARWIPDIVGWLGGDDAEQTADQIIRVVEAATGSTDPYAVAAALQDPSKAEALAVRLAQISAERDRARADALLKQMQAALADTESARQQTVALAAAGSRIAWAPVILSTLVVVGFFLCVVMLFLVERSWDERTSGLMNALFGALTISFGQVCNYWLGSSRGSAAKDERQQATMLAAAADTAAAVASTAPARRLFGGR